MQESTDEESELEYISSTSEDSEDDDGIEELEDGEEWTIDPNLLRNVHPNLLRNVHVPNSSGDFQLVSPTFAPPPSTLFHSYTITAPPLLPSLPQPVPLTSPRPPPSPLQRQFPLLSSFLPSSHPPYLLEPVAQFQPLPSLLSSLQHLGLSLTASTKALFWTGNRSLEEAADWSFSSPGRQMDLALEVEVAMWREDLRVREEEARLREAVEEAREEEEERLEELAQMAMQRQLRLLSSDSGVFCRREDWEEGELDCRPTVPNVVMVLDTRVGGEVWPSTLRNLY